MMEMWDSNSARSIVRDRLRLPPVGGDQHERYGHQDFVTRFAAAWAARDGEAFLALWHPDGVLHSPLYDRPVAGKELGRLTELVREAAPDSVWQLLDWTVRGSVVIVEWQTTGAAGGRRFDWRGVDKFRLRDGRIAEERVYMDTAALRAAHSVVWPEPLIRLD
jgi:ketosteroid isomerase-like protein